MGKKFIDVDGKKIFLDEMQIQDESVKELSAEERALEEAAEKISASVESKLGINALQKKFEAIETAEKRKASLKRVSKVVTMQDLMEKDIDKLSVREGLAVFLKSAIDKDIVKLKALSEGTAADGGNLFPKFIGAY